MPILLNSSHILYKDLQALCFRKNFYDTQKRTITILFSLGQDEKKSLSNLPECFKKIMFIRLF